MVLILLLSLSCFMMAGVSAEENTFTRSEEPIIYFEVPEDWGSYKRIFCCIYDWEEKEHINGWQTKISRCTPVKEKDNLYSYDISVLSSFDKTKEYVVIFSADNGMQTYETSFSSECYGDTLYCDGVFSNPPGFEGKSHYFAYWKNQDKFEYGPIMMILDPDTIVGTSLPHKFTTQDLFKEYLNRYYNAPETTDQEQIDLTASLLNFSKTTTARLIKESYANTFWKKENSTLPVLLGDANEDEVVNIKDSTIIQKHLAGYDITIDLGCADSDTNHTVNVKDATAIQKYIAGIEVVTPIGSLFTDSTTTTPA